MIKALLLLLTLTLSAKTINLNSLNSIRLSTSINESSVQFVKEELLKLIEQRGSETYAIYITMDSPGGSIIAGDSLIQFINSLDNVHTICIFCASMAHAISQGINGKRFATPNNIMMAHRAKGGFQGQFADGEVETQLQLFTKVVEYMEKRNAKRIGISLKNYKKKVINEWWTFGNESRKQNIVDEIVDIKCSIELMKEKQTIIERGLFSSRKIQQSKCPLM